MAADLIKIKSFNVYLFQSDIVSGTPGIVDNSPR
jgi:hypothetical protein